MLKAFNKPGGRAVGGRHRRSGDLDGVLPAGAPGVRLAQHAQVGCPYVLSRASLQGSARPRCKYCLARHGTARHDTAWLLHTACIAVAYCLYGCCPCLVTVLHGRCSVWLLYAAWLLLCVCLVAALCGWCPAWLLCCTAVKRSTLSRCNSAVQMSCPGATQLYR